MCKARHSQRWNFWVLLHLKRMRNFCQKFRPFHCLNPSHKMDQTTTGKQPYFFAKKSCSKFFEKRIFRFFFSEFSKRCLKSSSKGRKNNELKILSDFREIWEILVKFSRKKGFMILAKFFEKKNIPIFFWEYSKKRA